MTIRKGIVALILYSALAILVHKAPAQSPQNTIWMKSQLQPARDGVTANVDCETSAQDPTNTSNISVVATATNPGTNTRSYSGISTVCNVYPVGHPETPVWSSSSNYTYTNSNGNQVTIQADCPGSGDSNAPLGWGTFASFAGPQYTSKCTGSFAYTPGVNYQLTSQHYLWIANTCGSQAPYWDSLAWIDYIGADIAPVNGIATLTWNRAPDLNGWWNSQASSGVNTTTSSATNYQTGNWISAGTSETEQANGELIQGSGDGDATCWYPSLTILNGGVWELATTNATFTPIQITTAATDNNQDPNNQYAFYQSQDYAFNSNLAALQAVAGTGDNVTWCIANAQDPCTTALLPIIQTGIQGSLSTGQSPTTTGASTYFYAPDPIENGSMQIGSQTVSTPFTEYLCATETMNTNNYACASLSLLELTIELLETPSVSLPPLSPHAFGASLDIPDPGTTNPPANLVSVSSSVTWNDWSLTPQNFYGGTTQPKSQNSTSKNPAVSVYNYESPNSSSVSSGTLKASAEIQGVGTVAGQLTIYVDPELASQSITFGTIPSQTVGSTYTLAATSSSGLPITYISTTPAVVAVSGSTATLVSAGAASITAEQTGNSSYSAAATVTQNFSVMGTAAAPTFSPAGGTFNSVPTVTLSDASPGTTIYYTANGTTPTTSSTKYAGPTAVTNSVTVQAFASGGYYTASPIASATYSLVALPPVFSPPAGTYPGPLTVTIATASPGVDIFYTTTGGPASVSSPGYKGPITITSTETLNTVAAQTGWTSSADVAAQYTIEPYAATPVFSVASGTYASAQTVTITDAAAGATIYYTTNGTVPNTSSSVYSGPITVSSSESLNAIAVVNNYSNSAVATAVYTVQ